MWKIPKPTISALQAFDTCRTGFTNIDLKQRLSDVRDDIEQAEADFDAAAQAADLLPVKASSHVGGLVTVKEMETLYDRHMARNPSKGRKIYDLLMIAAPDDICPFCGHRNVSTLDHTLPKAQHPALAVTPINLIPCCKDCNHLKGNLRLEDIKDQLLNAYYDDVAGERWLYAEIVEGAPPGAKFFVDCPEGWEEMAQRVKNHFDGLELANLYASQAGRHLQNIRGALSDIYDAAGIQAVREDLERRGRGYADIAENSWERALYEAAAASDWYCDGGFRAKEAAK